MKTSKFIAALLAFACSVQGAIIQIATQTDNNGTSITNLNASFISQGVLSVLYGGTGVATIGTNLLMVGKSTGPIGTIANGTTNQVLTANGGSLLPTWTTPAAGGTVFTNGAGTTMLNRYFPGVTNDFVSGEVRICGTPAAGSGTGGISWWNTPTGARKYEENMDSAFTLSLYDVVNAEFLYQINAGTGASTSGKPWIFNRKVTLTNLVDGSSSGIITNFARIDLPIGSRIGTNIVVISGGWSNIVTGHTLIIQ